MAKRCFKVLRSLARATNETQKWTVELEAFVAISSHVIKGNLLDNPGALKEFQTTLRRLE